MPAKRVLWFVLKRQAVRNGPFGRLWTLQVRFLANGRSSPTWIGGGCSLCLGTELITRKQRSRRAEWWNEMLWKICRSGLPRVFILLGMRTWSRSCSVSDNAARRARRACSETKLQGCRAYAKCVQMPRAIVPHHSLSRQGASSRPASYSPGPWPRSCDDRRHILKRQKGIGSLTIGSRNPPFQREATVPPGQDSIQPSSVRPPTKKGKKASERFPEQLHLSAPAFRAELWSSWHR